jgi:hypothetical protein
MAGISGGLMRMNIAEHSRQADDIQSRIGKCHMNRQSIINARICIDNNFLA